MLFEYTKTLTTDGSGDETEYLGHCIRGKVVAIKYMPGSIATGATLTISGATSGVPILTKSSAGTSNVWFYPQNAPVTVAAGAAITDGQADVWVYKEQIKVVIASGGNATTGSITVWVDEEQ